MGLKKYILLILSGFIALSVNAQQPVAGFTNNVSSGCDIVPVTFTDQSTNNPTSWKWYFGNGQTSTIQNPAIVYTPGTYTVKLVATNAFGSDSITKTSLITVFQSPTASYTSDIIEGCPPLTINLSDNSAPGSSAIVSWQWDFGNGGSSNVSITTATYLTTGSYFISLRVTDANGCTAYSINTDSVRIHAAPVSDFSSNIQAACTAPLTVQFNNLSSGNSALTYSWNFGDGNTSTLINPSNTYNNPGSYNVTLTATDQSNCTTSIIKNSYINITGAVDYHADFSVVDTTGCSSNVAFTDMSSVGAETWFWRFGDGTTSTQQNPLHAYASSGTYIVTLISTNSLSCANIPIDSIQKTIHVTIYNAPSVDFTMDDSTGCEVPFTVHFTSNAPTAVSYLWDFGDGTTSNLQNPDHTFSSLGNHLITLTITDINGCAATKSSHVIMSLPDVNFIADIVEGCAPLSVNFSDASTSNYPITNWSWDFGDGSTSILQNPNHIYADSGSYSVTLFVTDGNGCQNSLIIANYIEAGLTPIVGFFADDTIVCSSHLVNFTNTSSPWAENWEWSFGDGSTSALEDPSHQYQDTGYFNVQLITEHHGCKDTLIKHDYIYVMPPVASFTGFPLSSCSAPLTVNFLNTSIGAQTFAWNFGDGSSLVFTENPSHTYTTPGMYDVTLTVTANSPGFCSDSAIYYKYIKISEINPGFTQSDTFSCQNETIFFNDTSYVNTAISQYIWDYGDGTIDTLTTPSTSHLYTIDGVYNVTHSIIDSMGCIGTITIPQCVTIQKNPEAMFVADTTYGCAPLIVNFDPSLSIAYPPASLVSWQWDFGDGTPVVNLGNQNIIQYIYNQRSFPNSYSPSLLVTDSKGCSSFYSRTDYITPTFPYPDISHPGTICFYDSLHITNNSSGAGLSYLWDFGDGSPTSTVAQPVHLFNTALTNTYTITLTVSDSNNCDSTITSMVKVSRPVANFYHDSITSNCPPVFVMFHDSSTSDVVSYLWNFGDSLDANNFSLLEDPQHRYNKAGDYTISLTVTNNDGCIDSYTAPSIQIEGPRGIITYGPKIGCAPLEVTFTAITSDANQYTWIYGNGASLEGLNTIYTYPDYGTFYPILSLTDTTTNCNFNIVGTQPIIIYPRPEANYSTKNGCVNTSIEFINQSTIISGQVSYLTWNFGDGISHNGNDTTYHIYATSGNFLSQLIALSDSGCTDTSTQIITIYPEPLVDFEYTPVCFNSSTIFTNLSSAQSGTITDYLWDFGDSSTSSLEDPVHLYNYPGDHNVALEITNSNGCINDTAITVHVKYLPIAQFDCPDTLCEKVEYPIGNLSIQPLDSEISQWNWDMGNSTTSNDSTPTLFYTTHGNYTIELIAITSSGCSDTASKDVVVIPSPVAFFSAFETPTTLVTSNIWFTNLSSNAVLWNWSFGDGDTSTIFSPSHTYADTGTYKASLTVYNELNCPSIYSANIRINPEFTFYIPNTFTPNNDNTNESFNGYGICIAEYSLKIYNRWGGLVFESTDQYEGWNGRNFNTRKMSPIGVYTYSFEILDYLKSRHYYVGKVTLLL